MVAKSGDDGLLQIPAFEPSLTTSDTSEGDNAPHEAAQLGSGISAAELKRKSENNEHGRAEKFKDHFEVIAIIALYGVAGVFAILGLIWFWHLVMPSSAKWLSADDISRLQNFVTGGIIATIAGGHIKKRVG